mmetsp:Transcript_47322/g.94865  ORF Transcript_47322/g.94865 Transcript_47322/m.94865 type:complete len:408 (+) Transcript_47322:146-1369(+)|eukprot:CAMPEP_0202831738 /NCGR_PEP_ID=MMETSP1389-20130828/17026_1 /ASSEMBLY_ACC=CAM_ASM_000865 /TAXON_ID=302021 /ORGANISM="Rhodomonas sp., Strain CCMP768" /LENGTH=407 /DNA_ID=CAMNT_0049505499 /DNA_START=143 /DNA_END=1366 /DNA_ORIENTATION=-
MERKRIVKPREILDDPPMKRQTKAPVRPDMLDPTFRAKSRPEKSKQTAAQANRRKVLAGGDGSASDANAASAQNSANHNKYCHFCQHVKVRASSMLACENQECSRRFCEHCLMTHLNEDVDPMSSDAWEVVNGKPAWFCPICRTKCCCSVTDCSEDHRHCKAYRYRRRRAELASKRMAAVADKRVGKKPTKAKPAARPTIEVSTCEKHSDTEDSPRSWPTSASSTMSAWSAAETEAGEAHAHSPEEEDEVAAEQAVAVHDSLATAVWGSETLGGVGLPAGKGLEDLCSFWEAGEHGEETMEEEVEDDPEDSFRGMYGMMCAAPSELGMGELEADDSLDGLGTDVDEAQWLRRTYETVYNPVARQRALNDLVAGIGTKGDGGDACAPLASFAEPAQPARKCTVMYDFV